MVRRITCRGLYVVLRIELDCGDGILDFLRTASLPLLQFSLDEDLDGGSHSLIWIAVGSGERRVFAHRAGRRESGMA